MTALSALLLTGCITIRVEFPGFDDDDDAETSAPPGAAGGDHLESSENDWSFDPVGPGLGDQEDAEDCEPFDWYRDADGDDHGDPDHAVEACEAPGGFVASSGDCDDSDADVHPGAVDVCDDLDNDCDGALDEDSTIWYLDADGDGSGDSSVSQESCDDLDGWSVRPDDCDDTDPNIHPDAEEILSDGIDQDCDGSDLEPLIWAGDITTEEEITAFCDGDDYYILDGYLEVSGTSLTNLLALWCVVQVVGHLEISNNPRLEDLRGLEGLDTVNAYARVAENPSLRDLNGLDGLELIGAYLRVEGNGAMRDLSGLSGLETMSSIYIEGNDGLLTLDGPDRLTKINGDLAIAGNVALESLGGLELVRSVGIDLTISDNESLEDLSGLDALERVDANLFIQDNDVLNDLSGLIVLDTVGKDLEIIDNACLTSQAAADLVEAIGEEDIGDSVTVSGNEGPCL